MQDPSLPFYHNLRGLLQKKGAWALEIRALVVMMVMVVGTNILDEHNLYHKVMHDCMGIF